MAIGNVVAGYLVTTRKQWVVFGADSSTKPVFFLGCAFGILGLLWQWLATGMFALVASNILIGCMQGMCASALLYVLMHRWKDAKGLAVGACVGALSSAELFGNAIGVLALDRVATCMRDEQSVPYDQCDAQFRYAADDAAAAVLVEACECHGFRPTGPLVMLACIFICLLGGLSYSDCYLGPMPEAAEDGNKTSGSPIVLPAGGLKYTQNDREQLGWSAKPGTRESELAYLTSCTDPVLRACVVMLLFGGTIQGALFAAINSLHHHDSSHGLDDQITVEEEKLLHGSYSLIMLLVAPLAGRMSDRLNRKVFVVSGVMIMVLGSFVFASAVSFQSDTGGRLAELFLTALLHGVGSAVIYGAAVGAVAERALASWAPLAVGIARGWWELGRVLGYLVIDPIVRGSELVGLCMVSLAAFVGGIWCILVFKDERAELGSQEDRPELQPSDDGHSEQDQTVKTAAP